MHASLRVVGNRDERAPTDRIGVCFCQHKCRRRAVECVSVTCVPTDRMSVCFLASINADVEL